MLEPLFQGLVQKGAKVDSAVRCPDKSEKGKILVGCPLSFFSEEGLKSLTVDEIKARLVGEE